MPSAPVFEVVRSFNVGELVTLYQLDLTDLGGSVYYFTNNVFEERVEIAFDGNTYVYMPIAMEGLEVSPESGPPQPRLSIATSGGPVNALVRQYGDLRGAKLTRIRTFAEFLDNRSTDGLEYVDENTAFTAGSGFSGTGPWTHAGTTYGEVRFPEVYPFVEGETYRITYTLSGGGGQFRIGDTGQVSVGSGSTSVDVVATSGALSDTMRFGTTGDGVVLDNVSVQVSPDNPNADPLAFLPPDLFLVDRKEAANKTMAEFQLVAPTDQEGIELPLRVVTKRYCDLVYRRNNGDGTFDYTGRHNPCPWGSDVSDGGRYYDINDQPCAAADDQCSKRIRGCALRFKTGMATESPPRPYHALPFSGFPGVRGPGEA